MRSTGAQHLASRGCAEPEPLQPGQDFGGELRQLGEIVNEVERQAIETRGV